MQTVKLPLVMVAILLLMASCSQKLVPFTQQVRDQYHLQPEEMKSIQFYFSNSFVLRRGENNDTKETRNGELTVMNDSKIEEVIIKAGTPCVINSVIDGNRITVSFEDDLNKYLVFGSIHNTDGYYTLMALEWKSGKGKVSYGENTYYSSPGSKDVFLALKMKSLKRLKVDQKVVKGATVN